MALNISVSELANIPINVKIGGVELKIRQLKIKELFGYFESKIESKKIKEAQEISELMNPEERKDFMIDVWKSLPTGAKLTSMAVDAMCSMDGVSDVLFLAAKDFDETITHESIKELITVNNIQELVPIVEWINGNKVDLDNVDNVDNEIIEDTEDTDKNIEKKNS